MSNTMLAGSDPFIAVNENIINFAQGDAIGDRPDPNNFFDSTVFEYTSSRTLHASANMRFGGGFNNMWEEVTFKGKSGPIDLTLNSLNPNTFQEDGSLKTLSLRVLNLEDVELESNIRFAFEQSDNIINFDNALVHFRTWDPVFISTGDLTINSLTASENSLYGLSGTIESNSTTINVKNGSIFKIEQSGVNITNSSFLKFRNDFQANVDASELVLEYSFVEAQKGTINLINGSTLRLRGSDTGFSLKDLYVENSSITNPGGGTKKLKIANQFTLIDSTLSTAQASYEVGFLRLKGTNNLTGSDVTEKFISEVIQTVDNTTSNLTVQNYNLFRAETIILSNNLTLNIDDAFLTIATGGDLIGQGGTINLTDASMSIFGDVKGSNGTINLSNDSKIGFYEGSGGFHLGGPITINLDTSSLEVQTKFTGSGTIGDENSSIFIKPNTNDTTQALLALGDENGNPIGSLTTDSLIQFSGGIFVSDQDLIDSNLFDGGTFEVDVQYATNNLAENDQIKFGANDVDITLLKQIVVNVADGSTANQLDRKEFTIISAKDSAATGNIVFNKTSKTVDELLVEGGSVPVLIDFRIVDNNTNGKEDITLVAEENLPINLSKHQNVKTRNHRGSASLVGSAAHTGNTQINNALNSLTNQQLTSHLDTIHPEGYSSYMTVGLEASLGVLKTVANNSRGANTFRAPLTAMTASTEPSVAPSVEVGFEKEFWADLSYVDGNIDEDGELGSIDYSITSFVFGQDLAVDHNSKVGAFAGYSYYKMNEHGVSDMDLDTDVLYLGMYHQYRSTNDWSFDSSIGYAYGMNESERNSTLGTISGTSDGEYDSHSLFIGSTAEKVCYKSKSFSISPEFGMYYVYYYQESFDESGNPSLDLSLESDDAHSLVNSIGLNFDFNSIGTDPEYTILPRLFIRYEHDWIANHDDDHSIHASLKNSNSGTQSFTGQNRGANHVIGGFNINGKINDQWNLNLGSSYSYNDNGDEVGINARISYSF
ncbi:autotransporter outer membrane beta-barrel domain-containing protein [Lentisphaera marina]|uniref:autotransporter family protein n=1 Tax=Lentisphaera marina TaxID=1111041 RepID=UPI002365AC00|nr:autotransporter outer membrane beta-barrel domain-containing protein [Lentisphaera marina]MDD7987270.1 autotransporter outer membrane beta-barrel domain-containing protein [Lentisphaera marina]